MIDDGADGARAGARARCEIFFCLGSFLFINASTIYIGAQILLCKEKKNNHAAEKVVVFPSIQLWNE